MQAIVAREPGDASVLTMAERPMPVAGAGEVLLRVPAAGITDVLGLEVCGEVVACGPGVDPRRIGQRLMALVPGGGYAPWCVASVDHAFAVPEHLSDIEAAALPEGLFTVWHNLFELGRLQMGETVLIHGGAGGIGTLAIRMAHAAGARVITTVGDAAHAAQLQAWGADAVICWRDTDFVAACLERTQGHGIDVVLDVVGGDYLRRNLQTMAFGGRHVSLSFMQGSLVQVELLTLMQRQLSLHSSTLRPQSAFEKTRMAQSIARHVLPLVQNGRIAPRIHRHFALAEAAAAHELLESGQVFGKLVLLP